MKEGDTYILLNKYRVPHLYIVISNPTAQDIRYPDYVFLVMLSSYEPYKDTTCVLRKDDHPFIKHNSVVIYKQPPALFEPQETIQQLINSGKLKPLSPVALPVLAKIRKGYLNSKAQKDTILQFLFRQGVVN